MKHSPLIECTQKVQIGALPLRLAPFPLLHYIILLIETPLRVITFEINFY